MNGEITFRNNNEKHQHETLTQDNEQRIGLFEMNKICAEPITSDQR